jgi:hypothetical protein
LRRIGKGVFHFFLLVNGTAFCFDLGRPGSSDSGLVL